MELDQPVRFVLSDLAVVGVAQRKPKTLDDLNDHDCVYYKGRDARAAWRLTGPNGVEERIELRAVVTADELGFVRRAVETGCPVHILQGMADPDVPYAHAVRLMEHLSGDDVVLTMIRDGDHRLSREQDISLLLRTSESLLESL